MKNKKWLWISLVALDVAITVFLFVIHIIMLSSIVGKTDAEMTVIKQRTDLVGILSSNSTLYLCAFVIPLFVILAANIIGLVFYVKKQTKKEPVKVSDLTDEQREALKKELLKDLTDK